MAHNRTELLYHLVFATKHRTPVISAHLEGVVINALISACKAAGVHVVAVGSGNDHVHLAIGIPPTLAVSAAVRKIKGRSSFEIRRSAYLEFEQFQWQNGYYISTVNPKQVGALIRYIANQRKHHG